MQTLYITLNVRVSKHISLAFKLFSKDSNALGVLSLKAERSFMDPNEEKKLIKAAQGGDGRAFNALLQEYYDVMYRIAFKWCGNRENAEDVTQNACIKLARNIGTFRFESKFSSWLYKLVINTAKDWQKANLRHKSVPLPEDSPLGITAPEGEAHIYAQQVMNAVRALPDKEKIAILLVCGEELSHAEAAAIMDCKESTVSWYIHEARKKLEDLKEKERRHG